MARLFGSRPYYLVCALATGLGVVLAMRIALVTRYQAHPDEFIHVDAFCYFEYHAWMPPLDLNGLNYGPEGESRVYGAEVVYWVYGRSAAGLRWFEDRLRFLSPPVPLPGPSAGQTPRSFLPLVFGQRILVADQTVCIPHYTTYRLFNVALLLFTLGLLFAVGARHAWAAAVGLLMLCLPQVVYLYAYANSDAWALSSALFLLVFALAERHPLASARKAALLGLLVGVVLLSKSSMWMALPFACVLIGYRLARDWRRAATRPPALWRHAAIGLVVAGLVIAPIRIFYPLSQGGHLPARLAEIRERRAVPGFKPSNPYAPGRQLRSKGVGFDQIVFNLRWLHLSAKSFYGYFGYLAVQSPKPAYWIAMALAALNALLTLTVLVRRWKALPGALRLALVSAPVVIGACVLASMLNSWMHDFQPQGRYLFAAVFPGALWMWGTLPWESRRLRAVHLGSAAWLLAQSAYVLWRFVAESPALR